jgi:putative glutathione S-transferase
MRRLIEYANLWAYTRASCRTPGLPDTVSIDSTKRQWYVTRRSVNPTDPVPLGLVIDCAEPHVQGPSLPWSEAQQRGTEEAA